METNTASAIQPPGGHSRIKAGGLAGCIALLLISGVNAAEKPTTQDRVGEALYRAAEDPRAAGLAIGAFGAKAGIEALGMDYQQVRRWVKAATTHRLTNSTSLNLEPNRINLETRHFNGGVVTEFSTRTNGDVGLSVKIPF